MRIVASRAAHVHACIANGENAAGGFGLTAQTAEEMFASGVDFITGGNHMFDKREFGEYLENSNRVIRPANYPPAPRTRRGTFAANGVTVGRAQPHGTNVHASSRRSVSLRGALLADFDARTPVIVVDFHAEATSEKVAIGRYLDGRVSCVVGTHTHVQTADEQIFPGGTAYISDLGMTGPIEGVIGMERVAVLERSLPACRSGLACKKPE